VTWSERASLRLSLQKEKVESTFFGGEKELTDVYIEANVKFSKGSATLLSGKEG